MALKKAAAAEFVQPRRLFNGYVRQASGKNLRGGFRLRGRPGKLCQLKPAPVHNRRYLIMLLEDPVEVGLA